MEVNKNTEAIDTGYAPVAWDFDGEVTRVFDDMIRRSIPQYDIMRSLCFAIGECFITPGGEVIDLGCARGEAIAPFIDRFDSIARRFIGLEKSQPMIAAARERFSDYIDRGLVEIREWDLRRGFPIFPNPRLILSVLTIQFIPIEYRQGIIRDIYRSLSSGGAFILIEKILGATADINKLMVGLYYDDKRRNGYTQDEIDRKRLSLEGKLVPVTASWNEELLRMAGFTEIDCFWRWMNFAGWVAIKR